MVRDTQRGQSKTGGGNAGHVRVVGGRSSRIAAVLHQSVLRIRLLPEEAATGALNVVEQLIVFCRKRRSRFRWRGGDCAERMRKGRGDSGPRQAFEQSAPGKAQARIGHRTMLSEFWVDEYSPQRDGRTEKAGSIYDAISVSLSDPVRNHSVLLVLHLLSEIHEVLERGVELIGLQHGFCKHVADIHLQAFGAEEVMHLIG